MPTFYLVALAPAVSYIGLEVSSAFLRGARVSGAGRSIAVYNEPIARGSVEGLVEQLVSAARAVDGTGNEAARAVGVAIPGIVTGSKRVSMSANLSVLDQVPLADELSRRLGRPALLENDANAAALAEAWQGAGRGGRSVLYISLGVGIGAGIVIDGHVWSGPNGYAGEIGHLQVEHGGAPCGCGGKGCLETVAGAAGWARRAKKALGGRTSLLTPDKLDPQTIVDAAKQGDFVAVEVVNDVARALGATLATAVTLLNIDRVVIGGGAAACPLLLEKVVAEAKERTLPRAFSECTFKLSELNDGACVLGAARVARVASMFGGAGGGGAAAEPRR
jgi:glucokinase